MPTIYYQKAKEDFKKRHVKGIRIFLKKKKQKAKKGPRKVSKLF